MSLPQRIAIDGPAASGKSTLGLILAQHFGYLYFDTGILYRAITFLALSRGLDLNDEAALTALAEQATLAVLAPTADDGRQYTVLADGADITWDLRARTVERAVSKVSCYPGVRVALRERQRQIGQQGSVVMAGRDIGAVIMPDAELKLYLDASVEERARRRTTELHTRGRDVAYADILADLQRRDQADAQNMPIAPDAVPLRTDGRSPAELIDAVLGLLD